MTSSKIPAPATSNGLREAAAWTSLKHLASKMCWVFFHSTLISHWYDSYEKLSDTTDAIQSKMAKARSDAKFTEAKLKKVNEQIRYLGQYLSTKSVYGDFLKSTNKKSFRQVHAEDIAKYEEALHILKQHSPDGKFPTMKDLRTEKEQLTIQKDAQYDTYHYFRDYHKELQTVCANVDSILETEREAQHEQQQSRKNEHFL